MEKRDAIRNDIQVIINFNFENHEKVVEAKSRNISETGMFIDVEPEILELMNIGESIVTYTEYQQDLFLRTCGYLVRIDTTSDISGFAMKYLDLTDIQQNIIQSCLI